MIITSDAQSSNPPAKEEGVIQPRAEKCPTYLKDTVSYEGV